MCGSKPHLGDFARLRAKVLFRCRNVISGAAACRAAANPACAETCRDAAMAETQAEISQGQASTGQFSTAKLGAGQLGAGQLSGQLGAGQADAAGVNAGQADAQYVAGP